MARDLFNSDPTSAQIEEARRDVRYYTTDYPVATLVERFKERPEEEGDIFIPDYQRSLQWLPERKSYFIESCILRIPIPPLFFYEKQGRLEVVDGSQRIRTLRDFIADGFPLVGLEKLSLLNDRKFSDLPRATARRLMNAPVRTFVLEETTDPDTRVELFRRLNTSSKTLSDAEIRKGAYQGRFLNLVMECANETVFEQMAPGTGSRGNANPESERQELVARFFVYLDHREDFTHDVRRFIDFHFKNYNANMTREQARDRKQEFNFVMGFIYQHMPRAFFRTETSKQVPRVRFEAISIGTALALRERTSHLRTGDLSWLRSPEFLGLVRTDASNSGPKLRARIEYVRDRLLGRQ